MKKHFLSLLKLLYKSWLTKSIAQLVNKVQLSAPYLVEIIVTLIRKLRRVLVELGLLLEAGQGDIGKTRSLPVLKKVPGTVRFGRRSHLLKPFFVNQQFFSYARFVGNFFKWGTAGSTGFFFAVPPFALLFN